MNITMSRVLTLLIVLLNIHKEHAQKNLRVYNGREDVNSQYSYVVSLTLQQYVEYLAKEYFEPKFCTGALITPIWVITAAHCINNGVKYIQYGNMSLALNETESKSKVLKRIKHPHYLQSVNLNDVALLLVQPVTLSKYGVLSAVDCLTLIGQSVEYAGYGLTFKPFRRKESDKMAKMIADLSKPLQIGEAIVKTCDNYKMPAYLICLSPKCSVKQTVLHGDSGGPLISDGKIVAVACGITVDYSDQYFTPISPYVTWIHHVVSTNE